MGKWQGLHANRFEENPLERRFYKVWRDINADAPRHRSLPDYLMHVGDHTLVQSCSDESRVAMGTVIQWLGSPQGQSFLELVLCGGDKSDLDLLRDLFRKAAAR